MNISLISGLMATVPAFSQGAPVPPCWPFGALGLPHYPAGPLQWRNFGNYFFRSRRCQLEFLYYFVKLLTSRAFSILSRALPSVSREAAYEIRMQSGAPKASPGTRATRASWMRYLCAKGVRRSLADLVCGCSSMDHKRTHLQSASQSGTGPKFLASTPGPKNAVMSGRT